jgi:signal transduction histidine kinase
LRLAASGGGRGGARGGGGGERGEERFLATISHEIRTPVNAILGYTELLALEIAGPLTDDQRRYLQAARGSGEHLLALIGQVLDFSRVAGTAQGNVLLRTSWRRSTSRRS